MATNTSDNTNQNNIDALFQQAVAQFQQGDLTGSESSVQKVLKINPGHAGALHLMGVIKSHLGQYKPAIEFLLHAISIDALQPSCHNNLGFALHMEGRLDEALEACTRAIQLRPDFAEAFNTLGVVLKDMGRLDEALEACTHAIKIKPDLADAHNNIGVILKELGRLDEAQATCTRAIQLRPDFAEAFNILGVVLKGMGRMDKALEACTSAIKIKPDLADAHDNRGSLLCEAGYLLDALDSCERAIQINPDRGITYYNLGNILGELRRFDEAEHNYRHALELNPGNATAHSNLLFLLASEARLEPHEMLEQQRFWDSVHGKEGQANALHAHCLGDSSDRRLRVGYVSPDFRRHPVSYFFEPLLTAHDKTRFEVFCYASHDESLSDDVTQHLRNIAEHWRFVSNKSDYELARLILADGIDILVDLAGHTRGNRLKAFTYRPAPVQATYLGYCASTGLDSMDYWITDEVIHPLDTQEMAVEHIYRLPRCSFSYMPPAEAPDVFPCPNNDDQVVFGSFSHLSKLSPKVIEVWSKILTGLPNSRLLLMDKYMADPKVRRLLQQDFANNGISQDRLMLRERVPFQQYLATYAEVDIVLDPFPRTGGTTTAEALWMGVPVVTLAGKRYVERISASKLTAVGLHDLIAQNENDYIGTAVSLGLNAELRRKLRGDLRNLMTKSSLCNGETLAREMETAYLSMWQRCVSGDF
jgi:predicted O-linked N-acetylglucosamine transferase (SPINDLY family)